MNKIQNKPLIFGFCLAFVVITFAVFFQVRNFNFINYDDDTYVTENRHVLTGLTRENIVWAFKSGYAANWHPLTWLSHMLDCQLFKTNPAGHHLANVLLHIINTLLLFTVLLQMTDKIWPSTFVAAAFALHPLHIESVAWVSERKDVLSTMFWLLTMVTYVRYTKLQSINHYLLALGLFALGLMSKPMLVTLPFVLSLIDYWPLERLERKNFSRFVREKIPFFALAAASSIITFLVQQSSGAVAQIARLPLNMRITNCFISYIRYIQKTIWPSNLAIFYPHPLGTIPTWQVLLAASLLLVISIFVIIPASRHKYLFVGWFWYFGTLIPIIGLVQVGDQAWAGRYSYVPLIGLFIIAAWGFPLLLKKSSLQKITAFIAVAVIAAFAVCTFFQLCYWRNSKTLFERALAVTENNYVAHYCLGNWLFQQGKTDESIAHYYEALRINPEYMLANISLGVALASQGQFDRSIEQFQYVMKYHPDFPELYYNLGVALSAQRKYEDALKQYQKAVELNPDYIKTYSNMGIVLSFLGRFDDAAVSYEKALQLKPDYAEAHNNFGTLLSAQDKLDEAVSHFRKALQLNPNAPNARCNLGYTLARQGKLDEGIAYLSEAIKLNRNFTEAYYYLAFAMAQKGQIDEAIQNAEISLNLAQISGNKQLTEQIQKSLDSYKTSRK